MSNLLIYPIIHVKKLSHLSTIYYNSGPYPVDVVFRVQKAKTIEKFILLTPIFFFLKNTTTSIELHVTHSNILKKKKEISSF